MSAIESLGLSAKQWQFLGNPDRYVEASRHTERPLVFESTQRQFQTARDILARLNGSNGEKARRGVLLADDVGLGKTTVAALVAWVVASAGEKRAVRILAPNDVMMRRWVEELRSHAEPLQSCAEHLAVHAKRVKAGKVGKLKAGSIQVVKHSYAASGDILKCDLLIIDEAHRAKGPQSKLATKLKQTKKYACRVLILTATPFSIHLSDLNRMLSFIGGDEAHRAVRGFDKALDNLYLGNTARDADGMAEYLAAKASAAVEALRPFVIRHGIDDLRREQKFFGCSQDWCIDVPPATRDELELLMRMDRALRLANKGGYESSKATNDPCFHVGWRHFHARREELENKVPQLAEPVAAVVENHLKSIKRLSDEVGIHHSKMVAVAEQVKKTISQEEKVVLFCHHKATAQELTAYLDSILPKEAAMELPDPSVWRKAWDEVLEPAGEVRHEETLRNTFIEWLSAALIRSQTWNWIRAFSPPMLGVSLAEALTKTPARHPHGPKISEAAKHLYYVLLQSRSSTAVLRAAAVRPELLPGGNGTGRVLGVCPASDKKEEQALFLHNQQPDTALSIFNSPFGPDVLVAMDRLSEGIDLHRRCRHLIHYELDPSPIRTVQRNGRLRRVNSWAAATGKPILYAYPAFRGTRDHRLVQIMKQRINKFSLLLGGVREINLDELGEEEKWRNDVIDRARKQMEKLNGRLVAKEPGVVSPLPEVPS